MEKHPIPISADVFAGLEAVRESGLTNMLDRPMVIELAELWGYDATAQWLREHKTSYARGIFQGFEVLDEEDPSCAV